MTVTRERLHELIESHPKYQKRVYIDYILELEDEREIELEELSFVPSNDTLDTWFSDGAEREAHIESGEHKKLKRYAASYFRETGCDSVSFEVESWFGRPDVGCTGTKCFAECGVVRVGKFVEAFGLETNIDLLGKPNPKYDLAEEIIYLPYRSNEETPPVTIISMKNRRTVE
jgi:hypothetical protein